MKKVFRYLAVALLTLSANSAFSANNTALELVWNLPQATIPAGETSVDQLSGNWDATAPNWDDRTAVKSKPCQRFATSFEDRVYTVNMKTMAIAEVTAEGVKDLYLLPVPEDNSEFYGSAITVDEAGNFLIGMNFLRGNKPADNEVNPSCSSYSVYNPTTGEIKRVNIPDMPCFRLDCVGRIIGDLTKEAYFHLAPGNATDKYVRTVKATGDGTIASINLEVINTVSVTTGSNTSFAQPAYPTLEAAAAAGNKETAVKEFYYLGEKGYEKKYDGVSELSDLNTHIAEKVTSTLLGFASFHYGNDQYFVRNYSNFGVAVYNSVGEEIAHWSDGKYTANGGYGTIVCRPAGDGTFHIALVVTGNDKGGAAALFKFRPVGTKDLPYQIATADDLLKFKDAITFNNYYAELTADIDYAGKTFEPIATTNYVHLEGNNHVISNIVFNADQAALFKSFRGSIKNMGMEKVNATAQSWGVASTFIGYAHDATIENCYSTGKLVGYYAGGIAAGIGQLYGGDYHLTVKNCHSACEIEGAQKAHVGGIVGRCTEKGTLLIDNAYFNGSISGSINTSAGIFGGIVDGTEAIKISNVALFARSVPGLAIAPQHQAIDVANAYIWDCALVNGVHPTDGKTTDELRAIIAGWEGFGDKLNDGYPVFSWQAANGVAEIDVQDGCEKHPYKLYTADDLKNWKSKLQAGMNYFTLEADIDMEGVAYSAPLVDNNFGSTFINLDGKNHVIKNLTPTGSYPSLCGVFQGEVRNLGLENINASGWGCGAIGGFAGHSDYDAKGVSKIENCYVTGKIGGQSYGGGLGGYCTGSLTISNCYVNVDVTGNEAAGLIAHNTGTVTVNNCYTNGIISGETAAGVINNISGGVTLNDVVAWNSGVIGSKTAAPVATGTVTSNNVLVFDKMTVNGEKVAEGTARRDLIATVTGWEAYQTTLHDAYPALAWQEANGLDNITIIGTEEDPYVIKSAADLLALADAVKTATFYANLDTDLDFADVNFAPISTSAIVYLDGQGHVIKNLYFSNPGNSDHQGLFATLTGEIKDLGLENVSFENHWGIAGAFVGSASNTTLTNCYATGKVIAAAAGGLIGAAGVNTVIDGCYADVEVSSHSNVAHNDGGLVGRIDGATSISNSYAKGAVKGTGNVAGIACLSTGSLTLDYVYAWNTSVDGPKTTTNPVCVGSATKNSVDYWNGMLVNGATTDAGVSAHHLQGEILHTGKFHATLHDGYPVNNWFDQPNGEGLEHAELYIAFSNANIGQLVEDGDFNANGKAVILTIKKHDHFTVKHKHVLAAAAPVSTLALSDDESYEEYSEPIKLTQPGKFSFITYDNGNEAIRTINLSGVTGIADIIADGDDANAPAVYYNLYGVEVKNPTTGVYLLRRGNKTEKVFVK